VGEKCPKSSKGLLGLNRTVKRPVEVEPARQPLEV